MPSGRPERARKSINYSKLSTDNDDSDKDDDDFMGPAPPSKKKKTKRNKENESPKISEKKEDKPPQERKARNRLSDEEKYQLQLEEALKISMADSETPKQNDSVIKIDSSQDSSSSDQDSQKSCTVQVDVMDSPNTKNLMNAKRKEREEVRKPTGDTKNEAILIEDDQITPAPKEIKETGTRRSGRAKKVKENNKDEDEYEMSDESESEDESLPDEESDESDYQESPKKKTKPKKSPKKKIIAKKIVVKEKKPLPKSIPSAPKHRRASLPSALPQTPKTTTNILSRTSMTSPSAFTNTPKSRNILARRSPAVAQGKFIQPGWTPPGRAGSKPSVLKSPESPSYIRVGLSRNARITPLHPRKSLS